MSLSCLGAVIPVRVRVAVGKEDRIVRMGKCVSEGQRIIVAPLPAPIALMLILVVAVDLILILAVALIFVIGILAAAAAFEGPVVFVVTHRRSLMHPSNPIPGPGRLGGVVHIVNPIWHTAGFV